VAILARTSGISMKNRWFHSMNPFRSERKFLLLLVSMVLLFTLRPLLSDFVSVSFLMEIFFSLVLLSGIYAASDTKKKFVTALFLAIPTLLAEWSSRFAEMPVIEMVKLVFTILFLGYTAIVILVFIFRQKKVTAELIAGAVCVYFLLGLLWGAIYPLLEAAHPGSFATPEETGADNTRFIYYSFVTLTTLGYGDITPLTAPARSFSILEAIIGQLYLAVLIARLVGTYISQSGDG